MVHNSTLCKEYFTVTANFESLYIVGGILNEQVSKDICIIPIHKLATFIPWTDN